MDHVSFILESEQGFLIGRTEGVRIKQQLCETLNSLLSNTVLILDFTHVEFIDVSCADEIVSKVRARIQSGEFLDRFLILDGLKQQHRENIEAALLGGKRAVLAYTDGNWLALGEMVGSYRDALYAVNKMGSATARELFDKMRYETINQSSTTLSVLYKLSLIGREPYRHPVVGGGRQFRYLSLVTKNGSAS